ncbi:autotransporter outer membrane beta-barrel domain-containing protein [Bradyrhizobium macuxiense]|uniref:autotransporter outer membrane beta-barrel domain-containing protein n=1 Tax=Bradyrhizobium macuxiense TaxID=1755647 RepID=UPI0010A96C37
MCRARGTHRIGSGATETGRRSTRRAIEVDAGIAAQINHAVSAYASAGYTTSVDSTHRDDITGRLGLRVSWH